MNFKDKRTRRICAASASAAVIVAGGVTVGATLATASGALALSTGNAFTTLDLGQQVTKRITTITATGGTVGNWTLAYAGGAAHNFLAADTAATVQTELNTNDAAIAAAGGVVVTGNPLNVANNVLTITFNIPGTRGTFITTQATNTATVNNTTAGGDAAAGIGNATFGTKITTTPVGAVTLSLDSYTAPSGVTVAGTPSLEYAQQGSGVATGPATGWKSLYNAGATGSVSTTITTPATQDVFVTAAQPGTYTFHFSDDNNTVGTGDDAVSPTVTMTVKDAEGATASPADDWAPTITNSPAASAIGAPVVTTVDLSGLTLVDTRSSISGAGILGSKIGALTGVGFNGAGPAEAAGTAITLGTTTGTRRLATLQTTGAGTMTSTVYFNKDASGNIDDVSLGTATTTVTDNTVGAVVLAAKSGQTANVTGAGNLTKVRTGIDTATYTATATNGGNAVAGAVVWFTLSAGSGTTLTDLTANGAAVPTTGDVAVTADANGVATLTVKSAKTANTNAYVVNAESNHHAGGQITATYTTAAATSIVTGGNVGTAVGGSATLTGTLVDQWSQPFTPTGGTQATLDVDQSNATMAASDYSHIVDITNGKFSFSYPDIASNTAARTDGYKWTVGLVTSSGNDQVKWLTSTAPASAALASLTNNAAATVDSTHFADVSKGTAAPVVDTLVGSVSDSNSAALPYTSFTLTGTSGVYFVDAANSNVLVTSLSARTSAGGALQSAADQSGSNVGVVFTKPGSQTITVTAGTVTKTMTFTVADAVDPYKVSVNAVAGAPGDVLIVTGMVTDAFGNAAGGRIVDLNTGTSTLGVLGNVAPTTNAAGVFSTTYTTGTNQKGTATLTATLRDSANNLAQTANATANAAWATDGVTVAAGTYTASSKITIAADTVALNSVTKRVGAGTVKVSGTARPGASVDLYVSGAAKPFATVTANSTTGVFSKTVSISRNTTFKATTAKATSNLVVAHVVSTVKIKAKVLKQHRVTITVTGGPSKKGTVVLWQRLKSGKLVKLGTAKVTKGTVSWTLKAGAGSHIYRATFKSTGCDTSSVVSISIKS